MKSFENWMEWHAKTIDCTLTIGRKVKMDILQEFAA